MPTISWIDALRRYNLGGTSWCVPRKGTPEHAKVMMIRAGAEDVKPKPRRRIIKAQLPEEKPEPEEEAEVSVPVTKTDEPAVKEEVRSEGKGMENIYFHKDKFDYTIWELEGDTFTQLADWNANDGPRGKAGFIPTMARKRKTDDGGRTYITPVGGRYKAVQPLRELYTSPPRLQREVIAGLEKLGYTKNIEFIDEATGEDMGAGTEYKPEASKPKKEKRVDTPEVVALLAQKAKLEADRDELVRRRDANEIPHDKAYMKSVFAFGDDINEIEKQVRKARLAQTKAMKK